MDSEIRILPTHSMMNTDSIGLRKPNLGCETRGSRILVLVSSSCRSQLPSSQLSAILRRQRQATQMRNLLTVSSAPISDHWPLHPRWLSLVLLSPFSFRAETPAARRSGKSTGGEEGKPSVPLPICPLGSFAIWRSSWTWQELKSRAG